MKKITVSLFALAIAMGAFAQKKNVTGAENKIYENDFAGAKSMIESAIKNPETANQTKTYWVAAEVYEKIYIDEDTKRQLQKEYSQDLIDEVLIKAVDAYKKTSELDNLPNEKGQVKPKYTKLIPGKMENYKNYLINAGLANYNEKDYESAVNLWSKYIEMADYPVLSKLNLKADTLYNEIKYYTINAAHNVSSKKDIKIQYMEDLKNDPKYGQAMHEWLYSLYKEEGNEEKMIAVLKEGIDKYPSNSFFIGTMINYYVKNKKESEALAYADEAIKKDPKNPQYYLVKLRVFLEKEDYDKAIEVAKQAIAVKENDFDANYCCGLCYLKKGESAALAANKIKDNKKYQAATNMAKEQFKLAIPYLEKARSINPQDSPNLNLLKTCYYRINDGAHYKEIEAELNKLK